MRAFLDVLLQHGECLTSDYAVEEARRNLELKAKDIPILGGAIAGNASHLLTGDERDFGAFFGKTIRGVKIVSPRMLADELVRQGLL